MKEAKATMVVSVVNTEGELAAHGLAQQPALLAAWVLGVQFLMAHDQVHGQGQGDDQHQ